jgi:hypothetical protein
MVSSEYILINRPTKKTIKSEEEKYASGCLLLKGILYAHNY